MPNRIAAVSFTLAVLCLSTLARADVNPLIGTWQLKSFVREIAGTGERYNQLGDHPDGYLNYSPDGRMLVFFVSADQPRPRNEPSDEERIKLHKSMLRTGARMTFHRVRLCITSTLSGMGSASAPIRCGFMPSTVRRFRSRRNRTKVRWTGGRA